ncbi:hypothetical protein N7520_002219 [Penicillium odoratum]|uniref:uncharacterized protein n=1 Tax=Penicillium odoratum TaxID=1167516 RepID=UPI002548C7AB|nr:uncharacterized protein N7520_002219 [Penicillium odoratum]KAJ5771690.1 hypothetical protein N7520_002219 [Penicillium odoratum]
MSQPDNYPIANLSTIGLTDLRNGSPSTVSEVVRAAKHDGMFYLDFTDSKELPCTGIIRDIQALSRELFQLGLDQKMEFDVDQLAPFKTNGYKPIGRNVGGIAGQSDGFESYALPCSSIIAEQSEHFPRPAIVDLHIVALRDLTSWCHEVAQSIFRTLSKALELPQEVALETLHDPTASHDIIRLLRYEKNASPDSLRVPQAAHTDLGSLTFLFTDSPGLQTCARDGKEWEYVIPKENCAIVNLGDAMSMWTEGALQSVLHRVASMPGQEMKERYSFALLMRPTNTAPMCSLLHGAVPDGHLRCEEWISTKFRALRGKKDGDSFRSVCRDAEIRAGRLATV